MNADERRVKRQQRAPARSRGHNRHLSINPSRILHDYPSTRAELHLIPSIALGTRPPRPRSKAGRPSSSSTPTQSRPTQALQAIEPPDHPSISFLQPSKSFNPPNHQAHTSSQSSCQAPALLSKLPSPWEQKTDKNKSPATGRSQEKDQNTQTLHLPRTPLQMPHMGDGSIGGLSGPLLPLKTKS